MMGVYIKGMEMPKSCHFCEMYEADLYWCRAAKRDIDSFDDYDNRSSFCPLVPVPPHGRLIDAQCVRDAIVQEWMDKADDSHMYKRGMEDAYEVIRNAPTIIPSEEGET